MPETTLETTLFPDLVNQAPGADSAAWPALERPQRLKAWSSDLVKIVNAEAPELFEGWSFAPGSLTKADFGRIMKKIHGCGSVLELRAAVDHGTGEIGSPMLHAANFCGQHTICPFCAGRVQDRRLAKWRKPIEWAAQNYQYAYMVTATTAPAETWREGVDGLRDAWRAFYLKGQKRIAGRSPGEWGKVRAGLAKMEIKRGDGSGLPHCHYHGIVFTNERLDYRVWTREEKKKPEADRVPLYRVPWPVTKEDPRGWRPASKLSYEWAEATGFSAIDFDVRPIEWKPAHKAEGVSYSESVFYQSVEVLKYATKFDSSPTTGAEKLFASDFIGIRDATYNRRLFHTYGSFRPSARGELCPFLDDGDDFTGGGPQFYDGPLIYESRWRVEKKAYGELESRSRPVFKGQEKTLGTQYRRTMLNRLQGKCRRMRTAIIAAKKIFVDDGELVRPAYMEIEYTDAGDQVLTPATLDYPREVWDNPEDFTQWEKWIDDLMDGCRIQYAELRAFLNMDKEPRGDEAFNARELAREWRARSEWYRENYIAGFFRGVLHNQNCVCLECCTSPARVASAPPS